MKRLIVKRRLQSREFHQEHINLVREALYRLCREISNGGGTVKQINGGVFQQTRILLEHGIMLCYECGYPQPRENTDCTLCATGFDFLPLPGEPHQVNQVQIDRPEKVITLKKYIDLCGCAAMFHRDHSLTEIICRGQNMHWVSTRHLEEKVRYVY